MRYRLELAFSTSVKLNSPSAQAKKKATTNTIGHGQPARMETKSRMKERLNSKNLRIAFPQSMKLKMHLGGFTLMPVVLFVLAVHLLARHRPVGDQDSPHLLSRLARNLRPQPTAP